VSEDRNELFRLLMLYSHVGLTVVFSIFTGLGIGWWLDHKLFHGKTAPYLTFVFLGFGIAAGFKSLWDLIRRIPKD